MRKKLDKITHHHLGESIKNYFRPRKSTNDVYIVDVEDSMYCIKISSTEHLSAFRSEPLIQKMVNRKTSIPVADVMFIDYSRNIIDKDFFIMEFIKGETLRDYGYENIERNIIKELKEEYRKLSNTTFNKFGYFHWSSGSGLEIFPKYNKWSQMLEDEVKLMTDKIKNSRFRYLSEFHRNFYKNNKHILEDYNFNPIINNSDYRFANMMIKNTDIEAILDWGSCFCGDLNFGIKKFEFLIDNPTTSYTISNKYKAVSDKISKFYEVLMYMYLMSGFDTWFSSVPTKKKGEYEQKIRENYKKTFEEYKSIV